MGPRSGHPRDSELRPAGGSGLTQVHPESGRRGPRPQATPQSLSVLEEEQAESGGGGACGHCLRVPVWTPLSCGLLSSEEEGTGQVTWDSRATGSPPSNGGSNAATTVLGDLHMSVCLSVCHPQVPVELPPPLPLPAPAFRWSLLCGHLLTPQRGLLQARALAKWVCGARLCSAQP